MHLYNAWVHTRTLAGLVLAGPSFNFLHVQIWDKWWPIFELN